MQRTSKVVTNAALLKVRHELRRLIMFTEGVEILVDLQTGAISMVIPGGEQGEPIELETVMPDEEFAPRE